MAAETGPDSGIAAIVVSYHSGPILLECLARLTSDPLVREIVLVDNGNPAEFSAALAARNDLTIVSGQGNVGFARGCNLGAARANAGFLVFINPDALVDPGALDALLEAGRGARAPWIAGARIVGSDGREQRGGRRGEITMRSALVAGLGLSPLGFDDPHMERQKLPDAPIKVAAVSGAAMLMPAADFKRLGGFDEAYFLHADDLDICRRARAAGGDVIFEPGARVMHVGATSGASALIVAHHKASGLIRYLLKFERNPIALAATILATPFIYALMIATGALRAIRR